MTQCLEIEQKFSVPKDYKTSLLSAGATLVSTKPLKDVYWDTPELSLLKQDVWLRQRFACFSRILMDIGAVLF